VRVELREPGLWAARFQAMGGPCEVLLQGVGEREALRLGTLAADEAWRIERKYSRYREDSVVAAIHRYRGSETELDEETAGLLEFARECHELSDGRFDITTGVLRQAWRFDGSDRLPDPRLVQSLLPLVGFGKLRWRTPRLLLPEGMEIDLGGLGKEYAVDRACERLADACDVPLLVNFGGDLRARGVPPRGAWQVGIERPGHDLQAALLLDLERGALATSGDARRYLLKEGVRYGHILDPRTGWPVAGAPRSVTVAASSCIEAGVLSTLAMLQGAGAAGFLAGHGARHWILH
jgi:thiamine biosynthesis lipoprotein